MPQIKISVKNKLPSIVYCSPDIELDRNGIPKIVCDNNDYEIVWELDEEWAEFEYKTMRINYSNRKHGEVLFSGDGCFIKPVPTKGNIFFGLYAGDIHTTRPVRMVADSSIKTDGGEEVGVSPDRYAQVVKELESKVDKNQGTENAGKALIVDDDGVVITEAPADAVDAIGLLYDCGILTPAYQNNVFFISPDGEIYIV